MFIRLLKLESMGKKSLAWENPKAKTQCTILRIHNKFVAPNTHLTIQDCGNRAFWEDCVPLLSEQRWLFTKRSPPWSLLTQLFGPACFYTDGLLNSMFSSGKDVCKSTHHGCEHICVNRGNSYICKCSEGFILAEDGRQCKSKWSKLGFLL